MNIIVVDDERYILNGEVDLICRTVHGAQVLGFTRSAEALDYVYANPVDVAILDINMPDYNGIDLARRMKIYRPAINIIFATAYSDYFEEAMRLHASGYMLKPLRPERLLEELSDLRHPVAQRGPALYVRTFGDFEVFWHDKP
ncbi:MAG: response regulator, partial [Clostridia bacterium]|nr:response regulator [Clostridia bacterium]